VRIHTRLLVLFLILIAFYALALSVLRRAGERISTGVLETQLAEASRHFETVLALERAPIENTVFDNTFWDEMVAHVRQPDADWGSENIDEAFPVFGIQQAWLYDPDFGQVYAMKPVDAPLPPPDDAQLRLATGADPFARFYGQVGADAIAEYFCGPIQPSDDEKRSSPPRGWLVAARRLDAKYLERLAAATGADVTLVPAPAGVAPGSHIDVPTSSVVLFAALRSAGGKPLALLEARRQNAGLPLLDRALTTYNWLYLLFAGVNLLLLGAFVIVWVRNPLQRISESLDRQDLAPVARYLGARHEFGTIARLIRSFLGQRQALLGEIEMRKQSERALREARDLADSSTRAKSEFLSVMSHELRTPLNAVIGYADMLLDEQPRPDQAEYLRTMRFAGESLLALVNDVLDFNRIEAGKLELERREFDPAGLVAMLLRTFRPQADAAGIAVHAALGDDLPARVVGDPLRLAQVLSNLLSNAIKFTPAGSVTLGVTALPAAADTASLEFRVTDTGIGIPLDKQQVIFEVFTQAESDTTRRYGGSGLGLTIAQRLVGLMGGVITVESEPNRGSTFRFTVSLPRGSAARDPALAPREPPPSKPLA
jgi:signal transduction histidine kinase